MIKRLTIISGLLSMTYLGFTQTFQKEYTTARSSGLSGLEEEINNGGFIWSSSDGEINYVDNNGNPIWSKKFLGLYETVNSFNLSLTIGTSEPITVTNNTEYILGGRTFSNFIDNDDDGSIAWLNMSPGPLSVTNFMRFLRTNAGILIRGKIFDVSKSHEDGFVAGGMQIKPGILRNGYFPIIFKCDNNGDLDWFTELPFVVGSSTESYHYVTKIEAANDGLNYIVQGAYKNDAIGTVNNNQAFICRVTGNNGANNIWQATFYDAFGNYPSARINPTDFFELNDGRILCTGHIGDYGYLLILRDNGTLNASYTYQSNGDNIKLMGIEQDANGGIWISGEVVNSNLSHILFQVDGANFNQINTPVLYPALDGVFAVLKQINGGFALGNRSGVNVFDDVLKTDPNGEGTNICHVNFNNLTKTNFNIFYDLGYNTFNLPRNFNVDSISTSYSNTLTANDGCCTIPLAFSDFEVDCDPPYSLVAPNGNFVSYTWSTGETTSSIDITVGNTYTLTVVDANGCVGTASYFFDGNLFEQSDIQGPEKKCCENPQIFTGPAGFNFYSWSITPSNSGTILTPNSSSTQIDWSNTVENTTVNLAVVSQYGCVRKYEFTAHGCCPDENPTALYTTDVCAPSYISTLGWGSSLNTNVPIYINNDLIIDANFTFNNCPNVFLEQDVKIIVEPGFQLVISGSHLNAKCEYMWDGIHVENQNSTVLIGNNSTLEQAKNAVYSINGGLFTVSDVNFINDYIGIKVENYAGSHPGTVSKCTFTSTIGNLLAPYNLPNLRMFKGIEINDVDQITIGDFSSISLQNKFTNMDYGIWSHNSNVDAYNNDFKNLSTTLNQNCITCPCQAGTAICASSDKGQYHTLNAGGPGLKRNTLLKNQFGIWCNTYMHLSADNNDIRRTVRTAIINQNSPGSINTITSNDIRFFNIGTEILDCGQNSNTIISQNSYNTSVPSIFGPLVNNTAIFIQNSFSSSQELEISYNNIQKINNGIFLRQVDNFNFSPGSSSDIFENDITFGVVNNLTSSFFYGIRLEGTSGLTITNNRISKTGGGNPILAVVDNLRGVSLNTSPNNTVANNTIDKMGAGVRAAGNCYPSTIECNELNQNYFGVEGELFANIGDQVQGPKPTGNVWNGSIGFDLDLSSMSGIMSWYYSITPPSQSGVSGGYLSTGVPIFDNHPDNCTNYPVMQLIQIREEKLGAIVRNEKNYNSLSDEFDLHDKKFAYKYLQENPGFLNLGTSDDTIYANFFNLNNITSAGKFNQINGKFELEDVSTAESLNNSIVTINNWDGNMKLFNEKYISKLSSGSLSSSDSTELWDLAWLNAINAGPGVISARAILNLDIEDLPNGETRMTEYFESENDAESETFIEIMPNPSSGVFNCHFITFSESFIYNILDLNGRILFSGKSSSPYFNVDLLKYDSGIYIIEIITDITISKTKLVKY